MNFKPPYWYHDNIKFSDDDLDKFKTEFINLRHLFAHDDSLKEQLSSYFVDDILRPEKRFNNYYSKIIEDIMKNVGLYRKVRYEYTYWSQLYFKNSKHYPHSHAHKINDVERRREEQILSWVHFIEVPEKKCFRFVDNYGNFLVPDEQLNGDLIVFPSWVWHEVLPNKSDIERIVIAGNIAVTYYDDF